MWLRAATSDLSRRFEADLGIRQLITELAAEGGVLATAFDREEERLANAPGREGDSLLAPVTLSFLPFWCCEWGASQLAEGRKRALEAHASIVGARRSTDFDDDVMNELLDDDAFDANVDGLAIQLLKNFGKASPSTI